MSTATCIVSGETLPMDELINYASVKPSLRRLILLEHPGFGPGKYISTFALNAYRQKYLSILITREKRELNLLEKDVLSAIGSDQLLSDGLQENGNRPSTFGERVADKIAVFGGSWTFILLFFSFLLIWMSINIWVLSTKPFDPYPFILLNLILSCLAAIQAPIIMMSQNRQETKDRIRNEYDFKVNLKAELEIRLLHEKLDHLMIHQNERLLEIQEIQLDYLQEISKAMTKNDTHTSA